MNLYIMIIIFALFLLFLYIGIEHQSTLFIVFAFALSLIIVFELSNTGIEYPTGDDSTITKINDNTTTVQTRDTYQRVDRFWTTPLLAIFSIIALFLLWLAVAGFEND